MAFSFLTSQIKARTQITVVDLGARVTKAVHVVKKGEGYVLTHFVIQDSPVFEKTISPEMLTEHLKGLNQAMGGLMKNISMVIGVNDSVFKPAEMPMLPTEDLRQMLKYGSKNYLQQDLPDHIFDCEIVASSIPAPPPEGTEKAEAPKGPAGKVKVLVGGAKRQLIEDMQAGAKGAGVVVDQIVPGMVCPPNALEFAQAEAIRDNVVAVVDIGFKSSTICILVKGELRLNRILGLGADKLTAGLAETMSVSYAEAEGIKVGLSTEVEAILQALITPLGQELRASINFFEHQHDTTVGQVFVSGGTAKSDFIVQCLQSELMISCSRWNPASFMTMELPPAQMGEFDQVAPQLAVAIGAAVAAF